MKSPNPQRRSEEQTTSQRFEAKYLVTELEVDAIKDFIAPYVRVDSHAKWGESYAINSMYLDSPDLKLFWSSAMGEKNRMKLRIRSYTEDPEDPVFFEIKRRVNQVILKQRALMRHQAIGRMFRREPLTDDDFVDREDKYRENFHQFRDYVEALDACPRVMVRYLREPYVSAMEEPLRITFDRQLAALPCTHDSEALWQWGDHWYEQDSLPVILEIKFTNVFPRWVCRMIERFQLMQTSFAKYVACVDGLKRAGISMAWQEDHSEDPLWSRAPWIS